MFENNREALYKAFTKAALRGNAYALKELSDRAYGKLKESHQVDISPYQDLSDKDLAKQIRELERKLGIPAQSSEAIVLPPTSDDSNSEPN